MISPSEKSQNVTKEKLKEDIEQSISDAGEDRKASDKCWQIDGVHWTDWFHEGGARSDAAAS